jgi:hypothetical protein
MSVHGIVDRLVSGHIGGGAVDAKSLRRGICEGTGVHSGVQMLQCFYN